MIIFSSVFYPLLKGYLSLRGPFQGLSGYYAALDPYYQAFVLPSPDGPFKV